jgi:hypothetical protein
MSEPGEKEFSGITPYSAVMVNTVRQKTFFIVNRDKKIFKDLHKLQFGRFY